MDWPEKDGMPMKQLREGTNGWICMPSSPAPPDGTGREDPMCADQRFSGLLEAWTTKSDPRLSAVGIAYMLVCVVGAIATIEASPKKKAVAVPSDMGTVPQDLARPPDLRAPSVVSRSASDAYNYNRLQRTVLEQQRDRIAAELGRLKAEEQQISDRLKFEFGVDVGAGDFWDERTLEIHRRRP